MDMFSGNICVESVIPRYVNPWGWIKIIRGCETANLRGRLKKFLTMKI